MLHPADRLHLVGVSLGAVLIIVSELALASVSLENVLVSTVTGELVGHPPGKRKKERGRHRERERERFTYKTIVVKTVNVYIFKNVSMCI